MDGLMIGTAAILALALLPLRLLRRTEHYLDGPGCGPFMSNPYRWVRCGAPVQYSRAPVARRADTKPSPVFHLSSDRRSA